MSYTMVEYIIHASEFVNFDSYIHVSDQNTFVATDTEFGRNFSRTLTTSDLFDCAAR